MNVTLTDMIVKHVLDNLIGLTKNIYLPLKDNKFLLNETLNYLNEENENIEIKLWGAEFSIHENKFSLLFTEFSEQDNEYILLVKLDQYPTYACYLASDSESQEPYGGLIAFSAKNNQWLASNVEIQANFLAGMEKLRDVLGVWNKLLNSESLVQDLKSFIKYQETLNAFEEINER